MQEEIWKDIPDFEGYYQVSNLGRIRSVERTILKSNNRIQVSKSKILKPFDNGSGYLVVHLRRENKRYVKYVHRLVCGTFLGKIEGFDINHNNFDKKDNSADNLSVMTRKENILYSKQAGHYEQVYIKRNYKTLEKYEKVKEELIKDLKNGVSVHTIEKKYNVNHKTLKKYNII